MNLVSGNIVEDKFAFSSSVSGDVWHPRKDEKAYEWWYFDALSDDGSEAITLAFLDNSVYSPRYNHAGPVKSDNSIVDGIRFPAVAFTYFRDGKQRYRTMLEFPESAFHASDSEPFVSIGENSMTFRTASYGAGYHIQLDAALSGGRRLRANFEWLAIESDHTPEATCFETNGIWSPSAAMLPERSGSMDEKIERSTFFNFAERATTITNSIIAGWRKPFAIGTGDALILPTRRLFFIVFARSMTIGLRPGC